MASLTDAGIISGTADKDYDLIWFTEACLSNALRLETYIEDARRSGDQQLADLFVRAQANSVRGAEESKALLRSRMAAA